MILKFVNSDHNNEIICKTSIGKFEWLNRQYAIDEKIFLRESNEWSEIKYIFNLDLIRIDIQKPQFIVIDITLKIHICSFIPHSLQSPAFTVFSNYPVERYFINGTHIKKENFLKESIKYKLKKNIELQ